MPFKRRANANEDKSASDDLHCAVDRNAPSKRNMQPWPEMSDPAKDAQSDAWLLDHADCDEATLGRLLASERIWILVVNTLKDIAREHGWPLESNADLAKTVSYLAAAIGDDAISHGYRAARSFHTNFHEDEYSLDEIKAGAADAQELVVRLHDAARKVQAGALPPNGATTPEEHLRREDARHPMNVIMTALRRQGLSRIEAYESARLIQSFRSPRVPPGRLVLPRGTSAAARHHRSRWETQGWEAEGEALKLPYKSLT